MLILAADLSERRTGFAIGYAGRMPDIDVVSFRRKDQRMQDAIDGCALWLRDMFERYKVDMFVAIHYMSVAAFSGKKGKGEGAASGAQPSFAFSIEGQILLHGACMAVCSCYGVPYHAPHEAAVRKHFCGKAFANPRRKTGAPRTNAQRAADREATKQMVIQRAWQLRYLPRGLDDDDMADAAAAWDFSCVHYARKNTAFALWSGA